MDKKEVAINLVNLHSDYKNLSERIGDPVTLSYSEAVAQAILLISECEEGGAE